jgi:plasmid stabilization system protein ParE
MIWRYHPEAAEEFLAACVHYAEISPELGRTFHDSIEASLERILSGPRVWPVIEDGVRRFVVRRFPYGIYYSLLDDDSVVLVVAVMDLRRRPGYWRHRIA